MTSPRRGLTSTHGTTYDPAEHWSARAACLDEDGDLFFAVDGERSDTRPFREATAKAVCRACPVKADCLADALEHRHVGIWGGLTDEERKPLHAAATVAADPLDDGLCGGPGGRIRHVRAGTPICRACLDHETRTRNASFLRTWARAEPLLARGMNPEQVATELGVSPNTIERAERTARRLQPDQQQETAA
jgi:WhiB family redox-sensing transcriptional regulator